MCRIKWKMKYQIMGRLIMGKPKKKIKTDTIYMLREQVAVDDD